MFSKNWISIIFLFCTAFFPTKSLSGTFNLVHFTPFEGFAVGVEPEILLTGGTGLGFNLKYTHGISDMINTTAIIGTSDSSRRFRTGVNLVFDFFPDAAGQPGIGMGIQALYFRLKDSRNQIELTAIPYIHKTFMSESREIEPFISFPLGIALSSGRYETISLINIGSLFKATDHFWYCAEFGIAINHTQTYFSGGIIYYH